MSEKKILRDVFIDTVWRQMHRNSMIFFLSDDFGSIALDKVRKDFPDRFINVGIAEQNLINVSTGLALEGYTVYAYGIATFLTMRPYEQLRNLSMLAQVRKMNVNIIGVGAGLSYDLSGPSHHCYEDISIMRLLPNFRVYSPSDGVLTQKLAKISPSLRVPKYIRLEGKPVRTIYARNVSLKEGFCRLRKGENICIVSTGYMTGIALEVLNELDSSGIDAGLIDVFTLKGFDSNALSKSIKNYQYLITVEEGFMNNGGLDSLISGILADNGSMAKLKKIGFNDRYVFNSGEREYLHHINKMDKRSIKQTIQELWDR